MVAVRESPSLESTSTLIVPELVPLSPDDISAQEFPPVTEAVQFMVPVPVFDTEKDTLPPGDSTLLAEGCILNSGCSIEPSG